MYVTEKGMSIQPGGGNPRVTDAIGKRRLVLRKFRKKYSEKKRTSYLVATHTDSEGLYADQAFFVESSGFAGEYAQRELAEYVRALTDMPSDATAADINAQIEALLGPENVGHGFAIDVEVMPSDKINPDTGKPYNNAEWSAAEGANTKDKILARRSAPAPAAEAPAAAESSGAPSAFDFMK